MSRAAATISRNTLPRAKKKSSETLNMQLQTDNGEFDGMYIVHIQLDKLLIFLT